MNYNIAAHPTTYAGVEFRSRLEARWAAFFDLVKWKWEYEPLDLSGWTPDFSLRGARRNILVEVKPILELPEQAAKKMLAAFSGEPEFELLIVGAENDGRNFGWLYEGDGSWGNAIFTIEGEKDSFGYCSEYGAFTNRITGNYDGHGGCDDEEIIKYWREAGNRTKWRPK